MFALSKYVDTLFDIIFRASFNHLCGRIHLPFPTLPVLLSLDWANIYKQTASNNSKRLKRKQNTQKHGERSGAVVSIRKSIGRKFEIPISSGVVDICVSLLLYQQGKKRREKEREKERERERERGKTAQIRVARTIYFFYLLRVKTGNESLIFQKLVAGSEMHALNTWWLTMKKF